MWFVRLQLLHSWNGMPLVLISHRGKGRRAVAQWSIGHIHGSRSWTIPSGKSDWHADCLVRYRTRTRIPCPVLQKSNWHADCLAGIGYTRMRIHCSVHQKTAALRSAFTLVEVM